MYFRTIAPVCFECTCAVLVVILVEFYKNRGRNHQEIPEGGCGRVSNHRKPLTQTSQALKRGRQWEKIKRIHNKLQIIMTLFAFEVQNISTFFPPHCNIPAGNRWAGAYEQWWLYWRFLTAASLTASCTNSQLLNKDTRRELWNSGYMSNITIFPQIMRSKHTALLTLCCNWLPCSSLTAHTMRSTQAALAWQRSFRGLCSPGNPPVSWSTRCSSDWLLLNCSSTKSCTSRTNVGCKAKTHH